MKRKLKGYIKISRAKNKQFKVTTIAANGKKIAPNETFHNRMAGAINNIISQMEVFNSPHLLVNDETSETWFILFPDGSKDIVDKNERLK